MTSRERVLAALEHKKTDRVPAGFHANNEIWDALKQRFGLATSEELLRMLGVDMRRIDAPYGRSATGPDADGYMRNMWGVRYLPEGDERNKGRSPAWIPPFTEDSTVEDVLAHPWPDPSTLDFSGVRAECEKYHGDYVTYGAPWSPFFHEVGWTIGQENFFVWMGTKPDVVQAIIDKTSSTFPSTTSWPSTTKRSAADQDPRTPDHSPPSWRARYGERQTTVTTRASRARGTRGGLLSCD